MTTKPFHNNATGNPFKQWKDACWAFIVDHARSSREGKFRVVFECDSQEDFERRVWARWGGYRRHHQDAAEAKVRYKREEYLALRNAPKPLWKRAALACLGKVNAWTFRNMRRIRGY